MRSKFTKKGSGGGKGDGKDKDKDKDKDKINPPETQTPKLTTDDDKKQQDPKTKGKTVGSVSCVRDLNEQTQNGLNRFSELATQYSDNDEQR